MLWIKRIFGVLYVLAGIGKAFPQLEDINAVLHQAALANQGTVLSGMSQWFSDHSSLMVVVTGLGLFLSGVCYLSNRFLIPAAVGQVVMLLCFMVVLHRFNLKIFFIDAPFLIVAVLVLREQFGKKKRKYDYVNE